MKKIILSIACCVAAVCSSNAQQHNLTVKVNNSTDNKAVVMLLNEAMRGIEKADTMDIVNGEVLYDFAGDNTRAVMVMLKTAKGPARYQGYVVPGEQGILTITEQGAKWSGSKFFADLAAFEAVTDPIEEKMNELGSDFQKQVSAGANRDSLQKVVLPKYQALSSQLIEAKTSYIKNNPNNAVSLIQLLDIEEEQQEELMALIADDVKNGKFSAIAKSITARLEAGKARREAAKKVAEGCMAPDFTLKDINGKDLSLSSLRGKYVIIDFWGSWCGWCIKGMPEMKKYYEKYKGKLEILGVDCNDTEQKWKDAVAKHELPWLHVYNTKEANIPGLYAVTGYPTKLIIDPQGKIIKNMAGEGPEFYQTLDEVLGK